MARRNSSFPRVVKSYGLGLEGERSYAMGYAIYC